MRLQPRFETLTPESDFGITHPLRPVILAGFLSLVLFSVAVAIMYFALRSSVSVVRLTPMALYILSFIAAWTAGVTTMAVRRPRPEEAVLMWGRIANLIILGSHVAAAWVIWAVMPHLSGEMQFFMVAFMISYVPTQVISSPENILANRFGIFAVLGSTAVFLVTRHSASATLLSLYVVVFGIVMFVLSGRISSTVQATVAARLASDAAAIQMEQLAKAVTAERDAKTRFISAASHDLGQPLQAIALFLEQSLRATDSAGRAKAADGARRALGSAEQLLSHMLNHLRLEADAVEPQLSAVSVLPLLRRIALRHTPAANAKDIGISVAGGDLALMLDPGLIDRALGNLVHNAIEHSRGSRLLLAARRHGNGRARLWVVDNGIGVTRTDAEHIFEDYYQGAVADSAIRSGFGLGLSSVRRTSALMGGIAGLDRRWQRGAAFYLEIPVSSRTSSERREHRQPAIVEAAP